MFRKKSIAAIIATVALIAMAAVLAGCASIGGYTGTAIIKEHRQSGKKCIATLETPDHITAVYTMGPRSVCDSLTNGSTVMMKNSFYQK